MRRWFTLLIVGAGLALLPSLNALAQDEEVPESVTVATKEIEPFVFVAEENLSGFSIDLWRALALQMDLDYEFEVVETVGDQLEAVESGTADVAIAAISITAAREENLDFSHRYFESGLAILTRPGGDSTVLNTFRVALSPTLLRMFLVLALFILLAGHVIWLIERRNNPQFPKGYVRGVAEGIWWSAVTVTTVGYGDRTPIGRAGRFFGIVWMFAGLFIIANFTAGVTSQLTLQGIRGTIRGPDDLHGHSVVTVEGSTSEEWLDAEGIGHVTEPTIEEAYAQLDNGSADAVVYDYPVLLYYQRQNEDQGYDIPGGSFNTEDYGIAVPTDSPLREEINQALLTLTENGIYDQIYATWYGVASQ